MTFTPLHQALGRQPGPIDSEMLDEAITVGLEEGDTIDWNRGLPQERALAQSDVVKDIAAFANSGGGVLVFGIIEDQRTASGRHDIGHVSEPYVRTLRRVAVSGIQPPVFGLDVVAVGQDGKRALVVVVPPSADVPHLIYRGDYFGAPVRNHADTEWMRERQLESLYRQRLDARRHSDQAIQNLHDELMVGRDTHERAWMAIVAYPRVTVLGRQLDKDQVQAVVRAAGQLSLVWVSRDVWHPFDAVDHLNPRRGMRRWLLHPSYGGVGRWDEAWLVVHDNGAISLVCAIGAHKAGGAQPGTLPGERIRAVHIEAAVADTMALLREAARAMGGTGEYDVLLGIEWEADERLVIETTDGQGFPFDGTSVPLGSFVPVRSSVRADLDEDAYLAQVAAVALDAINQGGVQHLQALADNGHYVISRVASARDGGVRPPILGFCACSH